MKNKISKILLGIIFGVLFSAIWFQVGKLQEGIEYIFIWKDALQMTVFLVLLIFLGWSLKGELED